jgi:hypothetical protein
MLVNDKNVLNGLEVKEEIKDLVVPITREEYSEYIMLRLMLAEAIDNMRMTEEGEAYMIYNVPKNVAQKIMPREYQVKFDDLVLAYEFKRNQMEGRDCE